MLPGRRFGIKKWPCVLGIGANVEDRGWPLELKWRLEGVLLGSTLGQLLSAKGPEGVKPEGGRGKEIRTESGFRTAKFNDLRFYTCLGFKL